MPSDDLTAHATSDTDFYALLGVTFETSQKDIERAYRKAALKYHPDKNRGDPTAAERFHLVHIATEVLTDPVAKKAYDDVRAARLHKQRQHDLFEGKRRQMKEDLERRESGFKRKRDEEADAEEILARRIRQLAADGERRRREKEEALRRELQEQERAKTELRKENQSPEVTAESRPQGGTEVPEVQRTVKVRWTRKSAGKTMDNDQLTSMFRRFGIVENAFLLPAKTDRKIASAGVIFTSIVGAHAAVEDAAKQKDSEWSCIKSVFWLEGKEPDILQDILNMTSSSSTSTKERVQSLGSTPSTPISPFKSGGNGLKKVPSFASFSSTNLNTPINSPYMKGGAQSPSLEEMTMIRLKNAEKRRLEEQIRKQEQEAAPAETS
ncbi:pre-mRNA-splicing factor cwc23 [Patellaria atrata CBS 101060]|uniref:Pre-mRNA-splicing factor cwc23 n=1 Tax=Patellaria atrata CBS 101060 TaxID=1346257 RepID=A0A9P4S8U7_9PEZI|nr:pre-mRNA-splicing factor cwc23 [Patellaria atrata CBS 101060]